MREFKNDDGFVPGMLVNSMDIKILICYLLKSVNESMDKEKVVEILYANDIAGYFDARSAICQLVEDATLNEDENGFVELTDEGKSAAEMLESTLPLTIRDKAVKEGIRACTMARRERENNVTFEKTDNGVYVTCSVSDGQFEMMSFRLYVTDEIQAEMVKKKFLENPSDIYASLINTLLATKDDTE